MSHSEKTYRVYCYDEAHKAVTADWLKAANDEEAIAKAQASGIQSKCELWDGDRLVAQLEANGNQSESVQLQQRMAEIRHFTEQSGRRSVG